ncbi:TPA: hypothetical protein ACJI3Y_004203, partial [Clostridioides difficile]
ASRKYTVTRSTLSKRNGGFDFSKPPVKAREKGCCTTAFSFAVVRQLRSYIVFQRVYQLD